MTIVDDMWARVRRESDDALQEYPGVMAEGEGHRRMMAKHENDAGLSFGLLGRFLGAAVLVVPNTSQHHFAAMVMEKRGCLMVVRVGCVHSDVGSYSHSFIFCFGPWQ